MAADPFTEEQVGLLLAAAARRSRRERAWITLLIHTGFRAKELLGCRISDVADGIRVRSYVRIERRRMKGGRGPRRRAVTARTAPISATASEALCDYLQERATQGTLQPDAPLFLSRNRQSLSIWRANKILKELTFEAGFADQGRFSSHSGRKAYGHKLYSATGDVLLARDALGHASVMTTEIYLGRRPREAFELTKHLWERPASVSSSIGRTQVAGLKSAECAAAIDSEQSEGTFDL